MDDFLKDRLVKFNHLKNIRDRLWSSDGKSRVSVMVGSGFSLNGDKIDSSLESMSTWNDIKNKIMAGLDEVEDSGDSDFNVLDISQRYVDEYGRESLDNLLKEAVPDQNYEPSEIHKALLRLPWSDVFTTNYDTLLERTLPHIVERNYQVIYDSRDISNSVSPRIVKLHGSFPSNRPFIFTRNDYDNYFSDFAPLVNMVQQSIMETTLVLIGFSGNDPNFEKWTKWVYENLGEHMPKIYMLAYNEKKSESFLSKRGITLIDFKDVYKEMTSDNIYFKMFTDTFKFLSYKDKKDKKDWPYRSYLNSNNKLSEALEPFIENRKSYPGWIIIPDVIKKNRIEHVQLGCNELEIKISKEDLIVEEKIKVLNEIIWAYDTFELPLTFRLHKLIKETVNEFLSNEEKNPQIETVILLILRLIKEARLDFNEIEFDNYVDILKKNDLTRESANCLKYEIIMMRKEKFQYQEAMEEINQWLLSNQDIEWAVKKAIILSQLGDIEEAKTLLENSLNTVRKIISIKQDSYKFLSLEGIILVNLINLGSNTMQNSKDRLSYLEARLANPLKELDFMYSRIKPYERKTGLFKKKRF